MRVCCQRGGGGLMGGRRARVQLEPPPAGPAVLICDLQTLAALAHVPSQGMIPRPSLAALLCLPVQVFLVDTDVFMDIAKCNPDFVQVRCAECSAPLPAPLGPVPRPKPFHVTFCQRLPAASVSAAAPPCPPPTSIAYPQPHDSTLPPPLPHLLCGVVCRWKLSASTSCSTARSLSSTRAGSQCSTFTSHFQRLLSI